MANTTKEKKTYAIHLIHEAVKGTSVVCADNYIQKDGFIQTGNMFIPISNVSVIIEDKKEKESLAAELGIDPVLIDHVETEKMKAEREKRNEKKVDEEKMEEVYTVSEVAKILKTNKDFVYKLREAGLLKFMKLGSLKCRQSTLEAFLEKYDGMDLTDPMNIKEL